VTQADGGAGMLFHVSDTFNLAFKVDNILPNILILSSDSTFFTVHYHKLSASSNNRFGGYIPPMFHPAPDDYDSDALELFLPEPAQVLNAVLYTIYGHSSDSYHPTFSCLTASIATLKKYGVDLQTHLAPGKPLYNILLNYVPVFPLEVYALAGEYDLKSLGAVASSYTLNLRIHLIPKDLVLQMGTVYLQRLFSLHQARIAELKAMLDVKLFPHVAKPYCSSHNRLVTGRAYELMGAQLFYVATPGKSINCFVFDHVGEQDRIMLGISGDKIQSMMGELVGSLSCPDCKRTVGKRVAEIVRDWVLLKVSVLQLLRDEIR
jgi:hypothetical protein